MNVAWTGVPRSKCVAPICGMPTRSCASQIAQRSTDGRPVSCDEESQRCGHQGTRTIQKHADETTQQLLKGCRWLLVKNRENLDADEQQRLDAMLAASPELKLCYDLKEEFRQWFQSSDRATAEQALTDWLARVEASGLKALQAFTRTLTNWKERILNYFDGRHSNGFAEGINLKVKLINRRGFGYRNFENFRLHVLTAF